MNPQDGIPDMHDELDAFLLIGQSNMAGRGMPEEVAPLRDPRVLMFRDNRWTTAEGPLHTDKPEIAGIGLGMSFAVELGTFLRKSPGCEHIGIVNRQLRDLERSLHAYGCVTSAGLTDNGDGLHFNSACFANSDAGMRKNSRSLPGFRRKETSPPQLTPEMPSYCRQ